MKKLKLDLDRIQVVSFAADSENGGQGTVNGHSTTFNSVELCGGESVGGSCDSCFPNYCLPMLNSRGC